MKKVMLALTIMSLPCSSHAACVIADDGNIPFKPSQAPLDHQYATYEGINYKGLNFYLRAGHGVARLEAWDGNGIVSASWYSYGRDPKETDSLRLEVRNAAGARVEAQCYGIDARIGE